MAMAGRASAFLDDADFQQALDGVADFVPARRSVLSLRPEQQLHGWIHYADQLEARLQQAGEQLARLRTQRAVDRIVWRELQRVGPAPADRAECADDAPLELLARLRAEQLMNVRLLALLARCAELETLSDPQGEAAAVLDPRQRQQLRAHDFEDALAEHHALRRAQRDELLRTGESPQAQHLPLPAHWEARSPAPLRLVTDQDT